MANGRRQNVETRRTLLGLGVCALVAAWLPIAALPQSAALKPAVGRATARSGTATLSASLRASMRRLGTSGNWGVFVLSLSRGDTLFAHRPDEPFLPASTLKLFTAALALDRFGPDGRFETAVLSTGPVNSAGVLAGDLVLRGAGDPSLGGSASEPGAEPPMRTLARQVARLGVRRITGAVVGDPSAFEDRRVPDGWRSRYLQRSYAARVSALSFNENAIAVIVRPNGVRASVEFDPPVSGIPLENVVKVLKGSRGGRVGVTQDSSLGAVRVSGWIGALSRPRRYTRVVENPELFAAGALRAALQAEGVEVDGNVRVGYAPDSAPVLASVPSPALERLVDQMNGESNNHYAELLLRNAARSTGAPGSAENANTLLRRFLYEKANVPPTAVFAADGSGLSTLDRITPRAMVHLLEYARRAPWGPVFERSLPVAGRTETLRHRMRRTAATGNLHAKTGTTSEVASLGGYVTARNGEEIAFAFIYNGSNQRRARSAIDQMGVALAKFTR
jgi:D-alanyl-D-alanine carboxypeptidase/D-alanyl-D-alanine-endopeptidase (penicillin-binding protein 4)